MLSTAQKDELKAKEDYEALSAAKEESITVGKEKLDAMQAEDAGNAKALSDAKEDLELTRKTRSEEILAVSEALAIITEDDNREMLNKAQGFFQISASTEEGAEMRMRRANAASSLRTAAKSPDFDADDLLAAWNNRKHVSSINGPRAALSTLA